MIRTELPIPRAFRALLDAFRHHGIGSNASTFTVRALRRGWRVKTASMLGMAESTLPLLLAIDYGEPHAPGLETEVESDREGRHLTRAAYVLACPPLGMAAHESRLPQLNSSESEAADRFVRCETWAVCELVSRASKKAVFLVPPGVLVHPWSRAASAGVPAAPWRRVQRIAKRGGAA